MPNIPRESQGLIYALRIILEKVREHMDPKDKLDFAGNNAKITLKEACILLRLMRLIFAIKML